MLFLYEEGHTLSEYLVANFIVIANIKLFAGRLRIKGKMPSVEGLSQ